MSKQLAIERRREGTRRVHLDQVLHRDHGRHAGLHELRREPAIGVVRIALRCFAALEKDETQLVVALDRRVAELPPDHSHNVGIEDARYLAALGGVGEQEHRVRLFDAVIVLNRAKHPVSDKVQHVIALLQGVTNRVERAWLGEQIELDRIAAIFVLDTGGGLDQAVVLCLRIHRLQPVFAEVRGTRNRHEHLDRSLDHGGSRLPILRQVPGERGRGHHRQLVGAVVRRAEQLPLDGVKLGQVGIDAKADAAERALAAHAIPR